MVYKTKVLLTLLFVMIINFTILGQHNVGLKVSLGVSKTFTTTQESPVSYDSKLMLSGSAGMFYTYNFNNKSTFIAELLFTQISGNEKTESALYVSQSTNIPLVVANYTIYKHISYLSLPLSYGIKINKTTFSLGAQISRIVASKGKLEGQSNSSGSITNLNNNQYDLGLNNYDWGPKIGLFHDLRKNTMLEVNYYYGMNHKDKNTTKGSNQQMTIGIRHNLWNKL